MEINNCTALDRVAKIVVDANNNYVIWGAGAAGIRFYEHFKSKIKIIAFVDSDKKKNKDKYAGLKIIKPKEIKEQKKIKIIICVLGYYNEIEQYLIENDFVENEDYFYEKEFVSIYELFKNDILKLWHLNLHITEYCTLKCGQCSAMIPYIKKPINIRFDNVCRDLERIFEKVDYIQELHLIGGEPMLYPNLEKLIKFIGENYRSRIGEFAVATNGTIIAKGKLLEYSRIYDVLYIISDYSNSEDFIGNQKGVALNNLLISNHIKTRYSNKNLWLDFGDPTILKTDENIIENEKRFKRCRTLNRVLREGKLYYCHHNLGAILADLAIEEENSYIDLEKNLQLRKIDLLRFDLGLLKSGYFEFCLRCNGYERLNNKWIPAAKQIKSLVNYSGDCV